MTGAEARAHVVAGGRVRRSSWREGKFLRLASDPSRVELVLVAGRREVAASEPLGPLAVWEEEDACDPWEEVPLPPSEGS